MFRRYACFALLACASMIGMAADQISIKEVSEKTGRKIKDVKQSDVPGWYEAYGDGGMFYVNDKLTHIFSGVVFDIATKKNLTRARVEALKLVDVTNLPIADGIRMRRGGAARKVFIYSDPNCTYCRMLESELAKIDNVDLVILPYPILSKDSEILAHEILCASDRAKAWREWMLFKRRPGRGGCDVSLGKILESGRKHEVRATPTLIFDDGSRLTGMVEVAEIERKFSSMPR